MEKKIKQKEKGKDIFYSSNVLLAMVMIYDSEGVDKTNLKQKSTKKGIVKEKGLYLVHFGFNGQLQERNNSYPNIMDSRE